MNFIEEYKKGQKGTQKGFDMGEGLANVSQFINGVQKRRYYGVASPPKGGKTTFTDEGFVIGPYLDALKNNKRIEWIYYSFEIDRISKEFDFATYFLNHDYGIETVSLLPEVFRNKKNTVAISPSLIRGRMLDDDGNIIKLNPKVEKALFSVYENRIIPLFGEFDTNGRRIKKGLIKFFEESDNPTGIYKQLKDYAEHRGKFIKNSVNRIIGYKSSESDLQTIVILDHMRKLRTERNFDLKQTVDKMSQMFVELRNWCEFTFVAIIHTNRNLANQQGSYNGSKHDIYPTGDDVKSTGNMSEDVDYMFTLMNPNDDKYKIVEHFGNKMKNSRGEPLRPHLRTIHLVESRHTEFPIHFQVNLHGNLKKYKQITN